jgi:hypothetical protein
MLPLILCSALLLPQLALQAQNASKLTLQCPPDTTIDERSVPVCIEFEEFETGELIDVITTPWGDVRVDSRTGRNPDKNASMVFDSGDPTRFDQDLGSPNTDFGGPGTGAGGAAGSPYRLDKEQGKVMILTRNFVSEIPNDDEFGGIVTFDFSSVEDGVTLHSMEIVDIEKPSLIEILDLNGNLVETVFILVAGDNGFVTVDLKGAQNVGSLRVMIPESGSIDKICFSRGIPLGFGKGESTCPGDVTVRFTDEIIPGSCSENYSIRRTYLALDECGNEETCLQIIRVINTQPPVILNCPTEPLDLGCNPDSIPPPLVLELQSSGVGKLDTFIDADTLISGCDYQILRTYVVEDECGVRDSCVEEIRFTIDTLAPVILEFPSDTLIFRGDSLADHPIPEQWVLQDDCGIADTTFRDVTDTLPGRELIIQRTLTVTDFCGNQAQATQTIFSQDTSSTFGFCTDSIFFLNPEVLNGLPDSLLCGEPLPDQPDLWFIDSQGDSVAAQKESSLTVDSCGGFLIFTWTGRDTTCVAGNRLTAEKIIEIQPILPDLLAPADDTVSCDTIVSTRLDYSNGQDSICRIEGSIPGTLTLTRGTPECPEEYLESWTLLICGDTLTASRILTVEPNNPPVILQCPPDVFFTDTLPGYDPDSLIIQDDCSIPTLTVREEVDSISDCGIYRVIRTFTATDGCGEQASCQQVLTRVDSGFVCTLPPDTLMACPGDTVFLNPEGAGETCTYTWTPRSGLSDPDNPNPSFIMPDEPRVEFEVVITSEDGLCEVMSTVTVFRDSMVDLTTPDQVSSCGDVITLRAASSTATEFEWSDEPGFDMLLGVDDSLVVNPTENTAYYVRAQANDLCPETNEVLVNVEAIEASVNEPILCELPGQVELTVSQGQSDQNLRYFWLNEDLLIGPNNGPSATYRLESPETLKVVVENEANCIDTLNSQIRVVYLADSIELGASPDTIFAGQTSELKATGCAECQFTWAPIESLSDLQNATATASPLETTLYSVSTSLEGCEYLDTVQVAVIQLCDSESIFIPNTFTPGITPGVNDYFRPRGRILDEELVDFYEFSVYNRWGERVYFSNNPLDEGWDGYFKGELMEPGVFGYILELECPGEERIRKQGNVTLIR